MVEEVAEELDVDPTEHMTPGLSRRFHEECFERAWEARRHACLTVCPRSPRRGRHDPGTP